MKHKLILLSLILPYLAISQVAKDTVTVLSPAQITAASPNDTANIYFVINNAWRKANFDSIARYTRVRFQTLTLDSTHIAASGLNLQGSRFTGTLPVGKGGTGQTQFLLGAIPYSDGTIFISDTSKIFFNNTNGRLGVGTSIPAGEFEVRGQVSRFSQTDPTKTVSFELFHGNLGTGGLGVTQSFRVYGRNTSGTEFGDNVAGNAFLFTTRNGTPEPNFYIGTVNAGNLIFGTSSAKRITITSAGETWIGYATDNGAYPLQVNGQIFATNATIATSDGRYKENIMPLQSGLAVIEKLNPVTYNFITDNENNFSEYPEVGFIAQDIDRALSKESYAKSIVKNSDDSDPDSPMGIAAGNLIPLLVKAIQEQQAQIEQLKQRIIQLENK